MTVLLIDVTGSFSKLLPAAVDAAKRTVGRMRGGDCLVVRPIGAQSFGDSQLPVVNLPRSSRPIDPVHERRLVALKTQGMNRLEAIRYARPDGRTDIWGALYASGQILAGSPDKALVIFSDMEDTEGLQPKGMTLRLNEVIVDVAFVPRRGTPAAFAKRIRFWQEAFERAGAAQVRFLDSNLLLIEVAR